MINIILLSGGSGTRLWPLSNATRSKQFLKVLRDENGCVQSMVQRTVQCIRSLIPGARLIISASETQEASLASQLDGRYELVLEPERRDTAPAIMLAVSYLASQEGFAEDDPVVVLPIDSFADAGYYALVEQLVEVVEKDFAQIALMGVLPSYPSSRFGYIVPDELLADNVWRVSRFKEKPEREEAESLIRKGALWNCGVFAFKARYMLNELRLRMRTTDYSYIRLHYGDLPKNSFDYEVVEHAASVSVVSYRGVWKDLGTWEALCGEMCEDVAGNVVMGECANTHVINELGLPLVALGVENAVVVATPDGILVADKESSANMKPYVERAAETRAMCENRRWGEYRILDYSVDGGIGKSLTKRLLIKRGLQISYQRHRCRNEVWTIVDGEGRVVVDGKETSVRPGDTVAIKVGSWHAVFAESDLSIIEVQTGSLLEEDDIERVGYYWD